MKNSYLVATGIVAISVSAESPADAIDVLKERIRNRERKDKQIGQSLVDALAQGRLNFIVMDAARTQLLCGEFNGRFQQPVTRALADSLRHLITDDLYRTTR